MSERGDPAGEYSAIQVPGLPGIYFREARVELPRGELRVLAASASDVLQARGADPLPYWCVGWPAGLALARHLAGLELRGCSVLEVGSGVAIAGLGAAAAGARVVVTDNQPPALRVAAMNARRSGLAVAAAAADWRWWPLRARFDLVVGSEVTYEPVSFDALLSVLERALGGGEALLAEPGRESWPRFRERALRSGWEIATTSLLAPGGRPVALHRLRRR